MLAGNQQDQHEVFGLQKFSPTQKFMVCQKKRQPFIHFRWFHGAFGYTIICIYIYIYTILYLYLVFYGDQIVIFDHFDHFWTILPYFTNGESGSFVSWMFPSSGLTLLSTGYLGAEPVKSVPSKEQPVNRGSWPMIHPFWGHEKPSKFMVILGEFPEFKSALFGLVQKMTPDGCVF